jgi:adenosine deaminase
LVLGLYTSMAEHPLDRLRRAGVAVSVNTDDSCLLRVTLAGRICVLRRRARLEQE